MNNIRHWFIQKSINNNCPINQGTPNEDAVFCEFIPRVSHQGCEWIKVYSSDDLHNEIGIGVSRYIEIMKINAKLKMQIEMLTVAIDFYAKHHHHMNTTAPNFAREALDKLKKEIEV